MVDPTALLVEIARSLTRSSDPPVEGIPMKLYADLPGRRVSQVLSDLFTVAWVLLWTYAGRVVHDTTAALRRPADGLTSAGGQLQTGMTSAGDQVARVPLVGEQLQAPFREAARTGVSLAQAGADLGLAVDRLALALGVAVAIVPVVMWLLVWLPVRARFIRRASAAQRFVDGPADLDLFALRALAGQPMHRLARIHPDPAGAWRARDPQIVRQLAVLELRDCGLRPPPEA